MKEFLQILILPAVQLQNKGKKPENTCVLTSREFLDELEEKERLKAQKEAQKQLRKLQREEKKSQKTIAKKVEKPKMLQQKVCIHSYAFF